MFASVLLLSLPVLAFAPGPGLHTFAEPARIRGFDPRQQDRLEGSAEWQEFSRGGGAGWKARFDEATGQPFSASGRGIDLGAVSSGSGALSATYAFLSSHETLFGVKTSRLPGDAAYNPDLDAWYVHLDQLVEAEGAFDDLGGTSLAVSHAEVWRGGFDARYRQGRLVQFSSRLYPSLEGPWRASISSSEAAERAMEEGPAPSAVHSVPTASLVLLPSSSGHSHRLCWLVRSRTEEPVGHWASFVDARSGELLHVHNEVRFLEGVLHGEHDVRTVDGEFAVSPLPLLKIFTEDGSLHTSEDGSYSFEHEGASETSQLHGRRTRVFNAAGDEFSFEVLGGEQILETEDEEILAQIDQYVFQSQIYDWAGTYASHVVDAWPRSDVNVNLDDVCNAYFDGELNFYRAGEGCNNTGRIADVSYHEWGHGFHYYNLLSGDFDGSMSEGIADAVAFFQTGDHRISPNFGTNGAAIREVASDRVYPDDIVNEVHMDGLIFAGAIWDLWELMEERYSEQEAYDALVPLFVQALRSGPDIPSSYDAFIFADDDNADLSDGTPHECEIIEAFGRHGLGPSGGRGFFALGHSPLGTQAPSAVSYDVTADLYRYAQNCIDSVIDQVELTYSLDGGENWQVLDAELSDDVVTASIPAQPAGTLVQYYVQLSDSEGRSAMSPTGGPINPFSFYVGELEELYCNDFETDDGGYTHELVEGQQQEGADDWMWGLPTGLGGDPPAAYSGDHVWGNDLGGEINGESYNGEYQNDKFNRLTSSSIPLEGYGQVLLSYMRWLNVEDGYYDQARIRANGDVIWSNHSTRYEIGDEHHADEQWAPHSVLIDSSAFESLQLSWEIQSDAGLTMGGWNLDDVCVYGVILPQADTGEEPKGGCSCSSAPARGGTWLVSVLLFALFSYRRRP